MKWVTYRSDHGERTGVLSGDAIYAMPPDVSLLDLVGRGADGLRTAGERAVRSPAAVVALDEVTLAAPIPRPPSIRDSLCFLDHMRNCQEAMGGGRVLMDTWYRIPAFYFACPSTVPEMLARIQTADLGPVATRYLRDRFGHFDFSGIKLRNADLTFDRDLAIELGGRRVDLLNLGPAHTTADSVVHVADAGVLFAGDLLFIGCTPIVWAGPIANWVAACDAMIALDAPTVVPGHGPVTGPDGIRAVRGYLAHIAEQAEAAYRKGLSLPEAVETIDLGEYASWLDSERVVVNVYQRYRELDPDTPRQDLLALLVMQAEWAARHCT